MNRGLDRAPVFETHADHQRFTELFQDISQRWGARILAYCCMTTHYHLFLQPPGGNLSRFMRHVDGVYTQRLNRNRGRDGPLFRGRYKAVLVDVDSHLLQLVRYIHLNPVEAGLVETAGSYPWSSHGLYRARSKPTWLAHEEVLGHFSGLKAFEEFVARGNDIVLKTFLDGHRRSPFLGSADFLSRALRRTASSREHPRRERAPQFRTVEDVKDTVTRESGVGREELERCRPGRRNGRDLAIYLAARCAGFSHGDIRGGFSLTGGSAITRACARVERSLSRDRTLRKLYREIMQKVDSPMPIQDLTPRVSKLNLHGEIPCKWGSAHSGGGTERAAHGELPGTEFT